MSTDNINNKFVKDNFEDRILKMDIPKNLKEDLCDVNNNLFDYSKKLNSIKTKVSFVYVLNNLRGYERRKIIDTIIDMFREYNLCLGKKKRVDADGNNIVEHLENIGVSDIWKFDLSSISNLGFLRHLSSDLKLYCKDVIKCIFIITKCELIKEYNEELMNESNIYINCKYSFDKVFQVTDKFGLCDELKEILTLEGFECDFNTDDISAIDEFRDNEIFIENALIKSSISKDDNKISLKDLNIKCNESTKTINLQEMIGLKNIKDELKKLVK